MSSYPRTSSPPRYSSPSYSRASSLPSYSPYKRQKVEGEISFKYSEYRQLGDEPPHEVSKKFSGKIVSQDPNGLVVETENGQRHLVSFMDGRLEIDDKPFFPQRLLE